MERTPMPACRYRHVLNNNTRSEAERDEQMREWSRTWPVGIGDGGLKQIEASVACCLATELGMEGCCRVRRPGSVVMRATWSFRTTGAPGTGWEPRGSLARYGAGRGHLDTCMAIHMLRRSLGHIKSLSMNSLASLFDLHQGSGSRVSHPRESLSDRGMRAASVDGQTYVWPYIRRTSIIDRSDQIGGSIFAPHPQSPHDHPFPADRRHCRAAHGLFQ
jgi:hypothetical protein